VKHVLAILILPGLAAGSAFAQSVPEGVHSLREGPSRICGITGANVPEVIRRLTASPAHQWSSETDRFVTYVSNDEHDIISFTKEGEPAWPTITCMHITDDGAGGARMERSMDCDASRAACDAVFEEFRAHDAENLRRMNEPPPPNRPQGT